ncbi:hypothetical protein PHYBOEH_000363 [Phytophthora boehmeriae]|uniref:RxLR effector protein n=1 Tax=Phytophthora boehmeriae TaxID=109152 RepID=A0A8T1WV17_9STRA|nr:hypothetical protein PHYBOEH_000363 [Phytophthora boehmeriae]
MRAHSFLLLSAAVLLASSGAASIPGQSLLSQTVSSDSVVSSRLLSPGESVAIGKRSLRARDTDEERGLFDTIPSVKKLMRELDLSEENAIIVRSIVKGHAPEKTLNKMGVSPSFVTADGVKVYHKDGEGYKKYLEWVKWLRDNYGF